MVITPMTFRVLGVVTRVGKSGQISDYDRLHATKFCFFPDYVRLQTTNVGYNVDYICSLSM